MVTLDLADELTFAEGDGLEVVDEPVGPARSPPATTTWCGGRCASSGARPACGSSSASRPGGGLGGGSADAAAVLRWAGVDDLEVAAVARRRRAVLPRRRPGPGDAASARWSSRCRSRTRTFTLLDPAVRRARRRRSTGRWDELGGPTGDGPNDLEAAALAVEPRLAEWRDRLGDATGRTPAAGRQRQHVVRRGRPSRRRPRCPLVVRSHPGVRGLGGC